MSHQIISTAHLDYLQRSEFNPADLTVSAPASGAPSDLRRLSRINGIGRMEKAPTLMPGQPTRLLSEDVLIGLYGYKIPLAFVVQSGPNGVAIHLGTWSPGERENTSAASMDARQQILSTALNSLYPAIELVPAESQMPRLPRSGFALGIPTAKPADPLDGALPLDRLIRALSGVDWACLVLAEPVHESTTGSIRDSVINEMREVQAAMQATTSPSPLGQHYTELLQVLLKTLTSGQAVGAWRTGVYLLGDTASYYRLSSVWRGIFSGDHSLPEPVRVWDNAHAAELATRWAMADVSGSQGPGHYHHPFEFQTLLTSDQLAAYIHLPQLETSGFTISVVPDFDAVPPPVKDEHALHIGQVIHQTRPLPAEYVVRAKAITRHTFVAGVTGSGKTNTIFHLLKQAAALGMPFLILEPAKTEYRALLQDPALKGELQIFTLGNENVSPLRLNPFEALPGASVSVHLDLLRSVFNASFGMWPPLPEVLEQCLHRVYEDRGWDLTTNTNSRLDNNSDVADAFPTLAELVAKADEVTRQLGYEAEIKGNIRAALLTRLNSLRIGSKGRMLDVQRSFPMRVLLDHPTVLELEGVGDDDDKAFLMGLLFIRLVEHRRAGGATASPQHLLVIEEAHRLLAAVGPQRQQEEGDPRGKAVETFANLLSEIRAYGQGVIVADQVPTKLAPDIIKNTNLKIAHRVVARDDRDELAGAMAMNERQARALSTFRVGEAAVFSDGDDAPIMVRAPLVKDHLAAEAPDDARLADHMARWRAASGLEGLFFPQPFCAETCAAAPRACEVARHLASDEFVQRTLARIVLSTIEEVGALDRMWNELVSTIRARRGPRIDETALLRAFAGHGAAWYASRRGSQGAWSYGATEELSTHLRRVLLEKVANPEANGSTSTLRTALQAHARLLHWRMYPPYPACDAVCDQDPPLCLYRAAVADLVASSDYHAGWVQADAKDATSQENRRQETWKVCMDAGYELIEFPELDLPDDLRQQVNASAERLCLCFAQQMLADDPRYGPRPTVVITANIMREAGR